MKYVQNHDPRPSGTEGQAPAGRERTYRIHLYTGGGADGATINV